MKDGNGKKIVPIIILLVLVVVLVFIGIKFVGKKSNKELTGEKKETVERLVTKYYSQLTAGMGTVYGGQDVLFQKDKVTYKDLEDVYVLNAAFNYLVTEGKFKANDTINDYVKNTYKYEKFDAVKSKDVKDAIKVLFGQDFKNTSAELFNYDYAFIYDETNDVYIRREVGTSQRNSDYRVYTQILSSTEKDKKVEVELIVAYVYAAGGYNSFAKDKNYKNIIFEDEKYEMKKDKEKEFDHFVITLNKDGDNYTFESIQKK